MKESNHEEDIKRLSNDMTMDNTPDGKDELLLLPITSDDITTCINVFQILTTNMEFINHTKLRLFRKHLAPISEYMEGRKFGGKGRKKYLEDKQLREEQRARKNRRKTHDIAHINGSALRRERIKNLNALASQTDQILSLPLIADGVGSSNMTIPLNLLQNNDNITSSTIEKNENQLKLNGFRSCYVCKTRFDEIHTFYDQLCPSCAKLNYIKRFATANLTGKVALVTGARVKIGFQVAIKLLLNGAAVIATTRFPVDAAERFHAHEAYESFKDRLQIYGIDFRDFNRVEMFMDFICSKYSHLDIVIHNACQTVRRPPQYYTHLIKKETSSSLENHKQLQYLLQHQEAFQAEQTRLLTNIKNNETLIPTSSLSAMQSQIPMLLTDYNDHHDDTAFPQGLVDVNGQQVDLRTQNSWILKLGSIETPEIAEVFAINTLAPFIMNNRLVPILQHGASLNNRKFIINVSAMEGKFYRYKSPNHPHTNMAKAALNMMTRTCAEDLAKKYIYMNSVDTGWINDENPLERAHRIALKSNFQTPIDEIDAAARIVDPIFVGYNDLSKLPEFGKFLKDYHSTEW